LGQIKNFQTILDFLKKITKKQKAGIDKKKKFKKKTESRAFEETSLLILTLFVSSRTKQEFTAKKRA